MSLTIVKLSPGVTRITVPLILVACAVFSFFCIRWDFVSAVAGNGIDAKIPEARSVADWLPQTSPGDPQAHIAAARFFERTFDSEDLERAQHEYETAVDLLPGEYSLWLLLARSRDRTGDTTGAETAYSRAYELAPNYTALKWAYGNSLVRHGRTDEGFRLIADAAHTDVRFRGQAVVTALQFFGNDPDRVRNVLGATPDIDAALTDVLAAQRRFTDAARSWSRIPPDDKKETFKEVGEQLIAHARVANEYRIAGQVAGDLITDGAERPETGRLTNGGFENGIKLRNAGPFEWQVDEGSEPQIGLSEGVRRSGRYSLFLTFNSFESAGSFRNISQLVPVEPGATYELSGYYRADLKTNATFKWEVVDAINSARIAITDPLVFAGDWTTMKVAFAVPRSTDGIMIRFVRLGCGSGACPVAGKVAFDDLSLTKISQ